MSKWKQLIADHKRAQITLVKSEAIKGKSQSDAARDLGMTRQQLNRFCKINNIEFKGGNQNYVDELIQLVEEISPIKRKKKVVD